MRSSDLLTPMIRPWWPVVERVRRWPVDSQLQARRNAMVAATSCARRRTERDDVAAYLTGTTTPAPPELRPEARPEVRATAR